MHRKRPIDRIYHILRTLRRFQILLVNKTRRFRQRPKRQREHQPDRSSEDAAVRHRQLPFLARFFRNPNQYRVHHPTHLKRAAQSGHEQRAIFRKQLSHRLHAQLRARPESKQEQVDPQRNLVRDGLKRDAERAANHAREGNLRD